MAESERMSLAELKAQNEAEEVADSNEELVDEPNEVIEEPEVNEGEKLEDQEESLDVESNPEDVEGWQIEDSEDDESAFVPSSGWKKQRLKTKALKADIREKDQALEELKAQVEALKGARQVEQPKVVMPTLEICDFDEAKYQAEMAKYYQSQIDEKFNNIQQQDIQQAQAQQVLQAREKSVSEHYDRAEKLVSEGKVKAEAYQAADRNIRQMLDSLYVGNGDNTADQLIATLNNNGNGSEKVWFYLGNNKAALNQLAANLQSDPSGMQAAMYLGNLQQKATQSVKRKTSNAPKPASKVKGDAVAKMSNHQKAYNKAESLQERISLKRKAKREGIDVSNW